MYADFNPMKTCKLYDHAGRGRRLQIEDEISPCLKGYRKTADREVHEDDIVYSQDRNVSLCRLLAHSIAQVFNSPEPNLSKILSKRTYRRIMLSKIASLLALVASANAHGYLSSPMSRTGLNAQVSPPVRPIGLTV